MNGTDRPSAAWIIWIAVIVLGLAHQDVWFWDDRTLVLGFLPIGLAYHAAFSLVAAGLWLCAVKLAWPRHVEEWADEVDEPAAGGESGP